MIKCLLFMSDFDQYALKIQAINGRIRTEEWIKKKKKRTERID